MPANGKVLIEVKGLRKAFGDNEVLKGIDTTVCEGEVIAIVGPSGCGKSTFLRSLNLLEVPTGGQILFEGVDITDKSVTPSLIQGSRLEIRSIESGIPRATP